MNTSATCTSSTTPGHASAAELEDWLRESPAAARTPPSVRSDLIGRLKAVSALLAEAGSVTTTPALIFRDQDGTVHQQAVVDGLVLGRKAPATLQVPDSRISRRHLEIRRLPDGWFLQDLNSTNGTRINGEAVVQRPLHNGDTIEAGSHLFVYIA